MVVSISDDIILLLVNHHAKGSVEQPIVLTMRPKGTKEGSLLIKDLYAVVVGVSHHDLVVPLINCQPSRIVKLPISSSQV